MRRPPNYDPDTVRPMWEELEKVRIKSLTEPAEVDETIQGQGTTLIVVNSVCGCAAGNARPGVMLALQNSKIPDRLGTVFAGMDHDAVAQARSFMPDVLPSSPCIALFKDGKPAFVMERCQIEMMSALDVARELARAFDQNCAAEGPSIPADEFEKIIPLSQCGSNIPGFSE